MNVPNTDEKLNFYNLSCLILDVGTYTLQRLFEKTYSTTDLQTFLISKQGKLNKLSNRNVINQAQKELLQPSDGTNPVLKDFDISLVSILLTNICSIPRPSAGWAVPPASNDISVGADILRLKKVRNELFAHRAHSSMDDATFKKEWKEIVGTVSRLSCQLEIQEQRAIKDKIETIETTRINCYQKFQNTLDQILHRLEKIAPNTPDVFSSDDEDDAVDAEIPKGPDGVICVLMEYPKLKSELPKDSGEKIAKYLQAKKLINRDEYEKIKDSSRTRRVCIDRLLKMVVHGSPERLECFFNQLKEHCPRLAIALSKRKVTEDDRKKFKENEKSSDDVNRIKLSHFCDELDVSFFQRHLCDSPEIVDEINDELLSQFIFSIWEHSSVTYCEVLNDMIRTLFEATHSCHLQLESMLQKKLQPDLFIRWANFRISTLHFRVLQKCLPVLEKKLDFEKVFTLIRGNKLVDELSCIDISAQKNKSNKIRMLVCCFQQNDRSVYEKFKECLDLSGQSRLKNILEEEEKTHFLFTKTSGIHRKWKAFLQWIYYSAKSIKQWFVDLSMNFITALIGSIILVFGAYEGFEVKLLNQSCLRIHLEKLIRDGCSECKIKVDGPVYVTVCIVSPGYDGRDLDIQFYLDFEAFHGQRKSKANRECHELKLLEEELNPSQLQRWILHQPQIGRDIQENIEKSVSNNLLSRREKMKCILDNITTLDNWREILKNFCERNDGYLYEKMLRESDQMPSLEGIGISPNLSYKKGGGLQKLYSMWININEDQGFTEDDLMEKTKLSGARQTEKSSPGADRKDRKCRDSEADSRLKTKVQEEDQLAKGNLMDERKVNKWCTMKLILKDISLEVFVDGHKYEWLNN